MKVLFIHCAYQYRGGEDTVVEEEMKLLLSAGVNVQLLGFTNEGNSLIKLLQMPFNLSSYLKTKKKIKQFAPDVVHIHNTHFAASPSVLYAVKHSKVPMVCTLHNYRLLCPSATLFHNGKAFLHSIKQNFPWTAVKEGVYKNSTIISFWIAASMKLHQWLGTWKTPQRFIVLSKHARKIFTEANKGFKPEQFVIKPNFCSLPQTNTMERTNDFLFVGRLSDEKGIPLLLEAFSNTANKLIIAGDGQLKEEVISCSKQHPNISYAGVLQKEEVIKLMQSSSALIFPSVWYEGMPLTIIEAFASGLPVIATKLGAMEYMVTPGYDGLLFEAGNLADLKNSIEQWSRFSGAEKKAYSTNAGNSYMQQYTPEKNLQQILSIYQSLASKQQPSPQLMSTTVIKGDVIA